MQTVEIVRELSECVVQCLEGMGLSEPSVYVCKYKVNGSELSHTFPTLVFSMGGNFNQLYNVSEWTKPMPDVVAKELLQRGTEDGVAVIGLLPEGLQLEDAPPQILTDMNNIPQYLERPVLKVLVATEE